jgi:Flp pilus assembly protein TadG
MSARIFRPLAGDTRGVTIIEFAVVAPVLSLMILGLCDLAYQSYSQSMLEGAVQKAARDSTLENASNNINALDQSVRDAVHAVAPSANVTSIRKSYTTFSNIKPEKFTDTNKNGVRDPGECYDDVNGNGQWDSDPGKNGQGGADDIVVYQVTAQYPRIFPMAGLLGWPATQTLMAKTVLKNQPYSTQYQPTVVNRCN